jgi:methyl-accepting chemotaxis protein
MLDFLTRPIRSVLGATQQDIARSVRDARDIERNTLDAVEAIERATVSIEKHVASLDTLATSIDPLRDSVDRLSTTLEQVVKLLAPMEAVERDVGRLGHLFGHRHEDKPPE